MSDLSNASTNQGDGGVNQPGFDKETFVAIKGLVQRLAQQLDEVIAKQKEYKERLKNLMDNDSQLQAYVDESAKATKAVTQRKVELNQSLEGKEIRAKIKELGEEIKDLKDSLTNNLLNYFQITGTQSFETDDGQEREFKLDAKLLPQKR